MIPQHSDIWRRTATIAIAGFMLSWITSLKTLVRPALGDFLSFYCAGVAAAAHANFYHAAVLAKIARAHGADFAYPYLYSPLLAQILGIFTTKAPLTPLHTGWLQLLIFSTVVIGILASSVLTVWSGGKPGLVPLVATAICVLILPVEHNIAIGQVNLLVVAFIVLAHVAYISRCPGLAGALLAPAVLIKGTPIVFIAFFVARRSVRSILAFSLIGILLIALSLKLGGIAPWKDYMYALPKFGYGQDIPDLFPVATVFNFSPSGAFARALPNRSSLVALLASGVSICVLLISFMMSVYARNKREELLALATFSPAMVLVSPLSYLHHMVYLIPGVLIWLIWSFCRGNMIVFGGLVLALAVTGVDWPLLYGEIGGRFSRPSFQSINLYSIVLVYLMGVCSYCIVKQPSLFRMRPREAT